MTGATTQTTDRRIAAWLSWCSFPGCQNCVRIATGVETGRVHCAVHATMLEIVLELAAPIHTLHQVLLRPKVRRGWTGCA